MPEREPGDVLRVLLLAFGVNFGLQVLVGFGLSRSHWSQYSTSIGLIAGNRNLALFLTSMAFANSEPALLFLACYQLPMYLTPTVMRPFFHRLIRVKDE